MKAFISKSFFETCYTPNIQKQAQPPPVVQNHKSRGWDERKAAPMVCISKFAILFEYFLIIKFTSLNDQIL